MKSSLENNHDLQNLFISKVFGYRLFPKGDIP